MRSIIFAFDIPALNPDKILSQEVSKVILKGYVVLPVYGIQEDIVILQNTKREDVGYVAVTGLRVTPIDEITDDEAKGAGFSSKEECLLFLKDETLATIANVLPVVHNGCECDCAGDCENGECQCGDHCSCKE